MDERAPVDFATERCICDCCGRDIVAILYEMPDLRHRRYFPTYTVVECRSCGHRYLNPRPSEGCLPALYPDSYYADRGTDEKRQQARYALQADVVESYVKSGLLFDVGCAGGSWMRVMQDRGWDAAGMDFVEPPHLEVGARISIGSLPNIDTGPNQFDVVTAWGVMEHIPAPSEYFEKIHKLLRTGGYFFFLVPNGDSLWSRWAYKEDIPRHLHFFRRKVLAKYAAAHGFRVARMETTNRFYSRPATGRGLFRRRFLRQFGAPWSEFFGPAGTSIRRVAGRLGNILDNSLIHPAVEERMGLAGCIVAVFNKVPDRKQ